MENFLTVPTYRILCDTSKVSDGYHTFGELYQHRFLLFCGMAYLAIRMPFEGTLYCWKSKTHWIYGELQPVWDGWFVAGIEIGGKMITYHLPLEYWDLFDGIEREQAPPHDGHTSQDVIDRLKEWLKGDK
jgi:hypothetical protein